MPAAAGQGRGAGGEQPGGGAVVGAGGSEGPSLQLALAGQSQFWESALK